ncbi:MAG: hypothetical protein U0905_10960 [Pirellulales bacterium]
MIIGLDEAGYGPNLGPFCIGMSVWIVPQKVHASELTSILHPLFQNRPIDKTQSWIPLGDSKLLYKSQGSAASLTFGLAVLESLAGLESSTSQTHLSRDPMMETTLRRRAIADDYSRVSKIAWYQCHAGRSDLYLEALPASMEQLSHRAKELLADQSIRLLSISGRVIDEPEFNRLLQVHGNKSSLLSMVCFEWIAEELERWAKTDLSFQSIEIFCDKHGGRNRYQSLLTHVFPECWFHIDCESTDLSKYHGEWKGHPIQWQFTAKGDSLVPSSVASMIAKWNREAWMDRLNHFWQSHLEDLSPTAGYPVDALRFAKCIEDVARRLKLERDQWWRKA